MRVTSLVLMLMAVGVGSMYGQTKVTQGLTIPISATGLSSTDMVTVTLQLQPSATTLSEAQGKQKMAPTGCSSASADVSIAGPSATGFPLGIPPDLCPGVYKLIAKSKTTTDKDAEAKPAKEITISPQYVEVTEPKPVVTGIFPPSLFRDSPTPYSLVFLGPASLSGSAEYTLHVVGHALSKCASADSSPLADSASCFHQEMDNPQDGQIKFTLRGSTILSELSGRQLVYLAHNNAESDKLQVDFVNAKRTTPRDYAIGLTAALVVLIYLLLSAGRRALQSQSGVGTFLLTALFLDEETQTYSLSKCQFYAWTFAAVLGYVYFAVARSIIQGNAVFPDIPGNLPGILLFSAGTSVISTGITSSKGSKGSGEVHPTLADFVTTGGVVAPERLQFVVWTVVGIFTFLTIVFKSDPLTLVGLPAIPDGFLQLMGISSAGYLAGKLARKPGPVAKTIAVADVTSAGNLPNQYLPPAGVTLQLPVLTLDLKGENLDPNGQIKLDSQPLRADLFWINHDAPDPKSGLCGELNVSLNNAATFLEGQHTLTIVNTDSQAADFVFPIDPMVIDSVQDVVPLAAPPVVTVSGKNFVTGTSALWLNAQDAPEAGFAAAVTFVNTTTLTVTRPANAAPGSSYKLTLISPIGLRESKKV